MSRSNDSTGLGYAYHLPSGGICLRIRNALSQFSDLFSEFNKYIAPAYHHDRCERSVHMRLYSMNKREFVMAILAFFACFGMGIFIGLAGPPITTTIEMNAKTLVANTSSEKDKNILAKGPFVMRTPMLTTYAQQLWLIGQISTDNTDDERFDKSFQVSVSIDGLTDEHKPVTILPSVAAKNRSVHFSSLFLYFYFSMVFAVVHLTSTLFISFRTRHLLCERNSCDEFTVLHLGFLDYAHYIVTVRFYDLESFHQRYNIKSLRFFVSTAIDCIPL